MRRMFPVLVVATIAVSCLGVEVAEAGELWVREKDNPAVERQKVHIAGKTGCKGKVWIRSATWKPGKLKRKAISSKHPKVKRGSFRAAAYVRRDAVYDNRQHTYLLRSRCDDGRTSGETYLTVLPFTGLPVLPQLLVGMGLIGGGAALVHGGRRPRRRARGEAGPLRLVVPQHRKDQHVRRAPLAVLEPDHGGRRHHRRSRDQNDR